MCLIIGPRFSYQLTIYVNETCGTIGYILVHQSNGDLNSRLLDCYSDNFSNKRPATTGHNQPHGDQTNIYHTSTGLVHYSDPHCTGLVYILDCVRYYKVRGVWLLLSTLNCQFIFSTAKPVTVGLEYWTCLVFK